MSKKNFQGFRDSVINEMDWAMMGIAGGAAAVLSAVIAIANRRARTQKEHNAMTSWWRDFDTYIKKHGPDSPEVKKWMETLNRPPFDAMSGMAHAHLEAKRKEMGGEEALANMTHIPLDLAKKNEDWATIGMAAGAAGVALAAITAVIRRNAKTQREYEEMAGWWKVFTAYVEKFGPDSKEVQDWMDHHMDHPPYNAMAGLARAHREIKRKEMETPKSEAVGGTNTDVRRRAGSRTSVRERHHIG